MATWEAKLWCAVLLTQSLPYLAAVAVAVVAAFPTRARVTSQASSMAMAAQFGAGD